jgi:pentatricopeptide repeat protein
MESENVRPNTISYNAAIQACANGRAWQEALKLFRQMSVAGVKRNRITYNAVVRALEQCDQYTLALDLREEAARFDAAGVAANAARKAASEARKAEARPRSIVSDPE